MATMWKCNYFFFLFFFFKLPCFCFHTFPAKLCFPCATSGGSPSERAGGLGPGMPRPASPGAKGQQCGDACGQHLPCLRAQPGRGRPGAPRAHARHAGLRGSQLQLALRPRLLPHDHVPAKPGPVRLRLPAVRRVPGALPVPAEARVGRTSAPPMGCSARVRHPVADSHRFVDALPGQRRPHGGEQHLPVCGERLVQHADVRHGDSCRIHFATVGFLGEQHRSFAQGHTSGALDALHLPRFEQPKDDQDVPGPLCHHAPLPHLLGALFCVPVPTGLSLGSARTGDAVQECTSSGVYIFVPRVHQERP